MVPSHDARVAVEVLTETEVPGGWIHVVRVRRPGGKDTDHTVRLAWVDHDHWCGGTQAPSRVTGAVIECLVACEPILELPPKFDASTARRWLPGIDEQMARVL